MPPEKRRMKLFLCHASNDKLKVKYLYKRLLNAGFEPWLDEKSLIPGQYWEHEIPKAVRKSDLVIICLSNNSVDKTGYVQKEIKIALDAAEERPEGSVFIIPARLNECRVPDSLKNRQWVDLFKYKGYNRLINALNNQANKMGLQVSLPETKQDRAMSPDVAKQIQLNKNTVKQIDEIFSRNWFLRSLLIQHQVFWRHDRRRISDEGISRLNKYLSQRMKLRQQEYVSIRKLFSEMGIFQNNPTIESGLIAPAYYGKINNIVNDSYSLNYEIEENYTIADFIWDVESSNRNNGSGIMLHIIKRLMSIGLEQDFSIIELPADSKPSKLYLSLNWSNQNKTYCLFISFESGRFTLENNFKAEILPLEIAVTPEAKPDKFYQILCLPDVGDTLIEAAKNADVKIILLMSLLKLFSRIENAKKSGIPANKILQNLHLLFDDQNYPISVEMGWTRIMGGVIK